MRTTADPHAPRLTFRLITLTLLVLATTACGQDAPDKQVNLLITEASQLYRQGIDADDPKDAITLLEQALANLDRIVQDFPETNAAVELSTNDRIGDLKRDGIRLHLFLARKAVADAEKTAAEARQTAAEAEARAAAEAADLQAQREAHAEKARAAHARWQQGLKAAKPLVDLVTTGKINEARIKVAAIEEDDPRDAAYAAIGAELARIGHLDWHT